VRRTGDLVSFVSLGGLQKTASTYFDTIKASLGYNSTEALKLFRRFVGLPATFFIWGVDKKSCRCFFT
jgi:hypothetical protein